MHTHAVQRGLRCIISGMVFPEHPLAAASITEFMSVSIPIFRNPGLLLAFVYAPTFSSEIVKRIYEPKRYAKLEIAILCLLILQQIMNFL